MSSIATATRLLDLRFQGHSEYIGCYLLEAGESLALMDPGPASTLPALESGLAEAGASLADVTDVLLTHIHLDHAGAAGTLAARNDRLRVHVHRRGARHVADPARLLASATRLYGERMQELWGEFLAVPEDRLRALDGGERLRLGDRLLEVAYTPGHAVHHVCYFEADSGILWSGDTAGIRIDGLPWVMPVTPPPDIDMEAWRGSLERLESWKPELVCPTHYGPARPAPEHLAEHRERLEEWASRVADDLRSGEDDEVLARRFHERVCAEMAERLPPEDIERYLAGGGLEDSWHGLALYWRRREKAAAR